MNELLDLITSSATRKAQVSAVAAGLGVVLTAVLPGLDDGAAATIVTAILAVLAAFGVTWATPNRPPSDPRA